MNRPLLIAIIFLAFIHLGCNSQPAARSGKEHGFAIDPDVSKAAANYLGDGDPGGKLDIDYFVNGQKKEMMLVSGQKVPQRASYHYENDSLKIILMNIMGGALGFMLKVHKDSASVSYGCSTRSGDALFKLHADDSTWQKGIEVPCKFYLVLNKKQYDKKEPAFGYVKASSNEFYHKNGASKDTIRVEFSGYFKAGYF